MLKAGRIMSQVSLLLVSSFVERGKEALKLFPDDVFSVVTLKLMHELLLEILKLLKNCCVGYVGSRALSSRTGGVSLLAGIC